MLRSQLHVAMRKSRQPHRIAANSATGAAKPLHAIRNFARAILPRVVGRAAVMARRRIPWHQVKQNMPRA
jgi:hypothetical protein